ncbi:hypothetical protein LXL04_030238 [Taraxacum kok-saghyz]
MRLLDLPNFVLLKHCFLINNTILWLCCNLYIVVAYRHVPELLDEDKKAKKENDATPVLRPLNLDDFIRWAHLLLMMQQVLMNSQNGTSNMESLKDVVLTFKNLTFMI